MSKTANSFFKTIIANMSASQNFTSNESWAAIMKNCCRDYFSQEHPSSVSDSQEHHPSGPDIQCCVFEVPKKLLDTKRDAYTPKKVGLGPYHHRRSDLELTTNQKLGAVQDYLIINEVQNFINLVEGCPQTIQEITRKCYEGHRDLDGGSLAWIVIIDSIFLLHFLQTNSHEQEHSEHHDAASSNELFFQDLLMLENQIPFYLIKETKLMFSNNDMLRNNEDDISFTDKIVDFCSKHSPFQVTGDERLSCAAIHEGHHMLDFMHRLILGPSEEVEYKESDTTKVSCLERLHGLQQHAVSQIEVLRDELLSQHKKAKVQCVEVPEILEKLCCLVERLKSRSSDVKKRLLPSVSLLRQVLQITFAPGGFGLRAARFVNGDDNKTLYLPVMKLDANSEVILRNLMAYEAKKANLSEQASVIDFVEFMCNIIRGQDDVKILKSANIIEGGLQDEEIVELFNNLEKAIDNTDRKKSNSIISAIVVKVNELFNNERVVKACAWIIKFLILLFPVLVFLLLLFQSFCEVYDCRRWWRLSFEPFGEVGRGDRQPSGKASVLSLGGQTELMPARKFLRY